MNYTNVYRCENICNATNGDTLPRSEVVFLFAFYFCQEINSMFITVGPIFKWKRCTLKKIKNRNLPTCVTERDISSICGWIFFGYYVTVFDYLFLGESFELGIWQFNYTDTYVFNILKLFLRTNFGPMMWRIKIDWVILNFWKLHYIPLLIQRIGRSCNGKKFKSKCNNSW